MRPGRRAVLAVVVAAAIGSAISLAGARDGRPSWPEEKCARYAKAWTEALKRRGAEGLGREFLARHDAFIASGCTASIEVCPRSEQELAMANILVMASYNAGMGSTFTPFACRKQGVGAVRPP
jgi:hypothetical protein